MQNLSDQPITVLLRRWREGDQSALDTLTPLVYDQLRSLANRSFHSENEGHTLRATAVVHEAYLRLRDAEIPFQDRAHFFAIAARMMRRLLVDHAKHAHRAKRDKRANLSLEEAFLLTNQPDGRILDLDEALGRLAVFDLRKSELVEMSYFGGLTYEEAGAVLEISPATVHRELRMAKAWLRNEMETGAHIT